MLKLVRVSVTWGPVNIDNMICMTLGRSCAVWCYNMLRCNEAACHFMLHCTVPCCAKLCHTCHRAGRAACLQQKAGSSGVHVRPNSASKDLLPENTRKLVCNVSKHSLCGCIGAARLHAATSDETSAVFSCLPHCWGVWWFQRNSEPTCSSTSFWRRRSTVSLWRASLAWPDLRSCSNTASTASTCMHAQLAGTGHCRKLHRTL